jgi:microcystin-dependent protein
MPEIIDVVDSEDLAVAEWANAIRDRTVQRYNDLSTRTTEHATPAAGDLSFLEDSGALEVYFGGSWRGLLPTGAVIAHAGTTAPSGWLLANGAEVSRTTYAALFAVIGTVFGVGDGSTTFNLPNLKQRFPLGKADSGTGAAVGATGGAIDHVHSGPSHTHTGPSHTHTMGTHTHSNPSTAANGSHAHFIDGGATASGGSHTHSFSDSFTTGGGSGTTSKEGGAFLASVPAHTHTGSVSGTTGSGGSHTHGPGTLDTDSAGSHTHTQGVTGATDPGDTNAAGTGATGAGGTGSTGTQNPPFLTLLFIVKI